MVTLSFVIRYAWSVFFCSPLYSIFRRSSEPTCHRSTLTPYSTLNQQDRYCRVMKTLWLVKIRGYKESWSFIKHMPHRNVLQIKVVRLNEICVSCHVPGFAGIHYFTLWRTVYCVMQHWMVWHKVTTILEAPPKYVFWLPDYMVSHPVWLQPSYSLSW